MIGSFQGYNINKENLSKILKGFQEMRAKVNKKIEISGCKGIYISVSVQTFLRFF